MSKPEDIPQDIWDAAGKAFLNNGNSPLVQAAISHAILAEREACAKTAANYRANMSIWMTSEWPTAKLAGNYAAQEIAAAISNRGNQP